MDLSQAVARTLRRTGHLCVPEVAEGFLKYIDLLEKWNRRVNLTASTAWEAIEPLIEEAAWAARYYPLTESRHLDIGSGAGFPAIPMRILRPKMRLQLLEGRMKRAVFLEAVARELELEETRVINRRLEEYLREVDPNECWDTISWKAVRLGIPEIRCLRERSDKVTQFWLFHGKALPLAEPVAWEKSMALIRRMPCPARENWFLSIYREGVPD